MSTTKKIARLGVLVLAGILARTEPGLTQGFIIPRHHPSHTVPMPDLMRHEVHVKIDDQVSRVEVRQVFYNGFHMPMEGTYYFPLPKEASISDFKMTVNGKVLSGELLEKDKARKMYEDIVRRQIDPALLEYVDHQLFSARIFPIPPREEREIVLEYTLLLKKNGSLVQFSYPLRGTLAAERNVPRVDILPVRDAVHSGSDRPGMGNETDQLILIDLESRISIKNIYSPSHNVDIDRRDDRHARISYEGKRRSSSENFILYYGLTDDDFGLNAITFRPDSREKAFYMLLISPRTDFSGDEISRKDIVFILDVSGSMRGEKIEQAKEALKYCISHLNRSDRFNIMTFSTEPRLFQPRLVDAASREREALDYIQGIEANGGTNIHDALVQAMQMPFDPNRPSSIVFITDGLPTVGITDIGKIVEGVSGNNKAGIKIFTFGVGYDVNTVLLDRIAQESRSVSDYIEPEENIEEKISSFYDKVGHPVLTDLRVEYRGVEVEDVYPRNLSDLFRGSQLTLMGRYDRGGSVGITLRGKINGRDMRWTYDADFSRESSNHDFLPHLWATRKIGYLMDEIRLHGENEELKEEIIRLSKTYGVMSPYTSYLVQEDESFTGRQSFAPGVSAQAMPVLSRDKGIGGVAKNEALSMDHGSYAVDMSKKSREMREADALGESRMDVKWVNGRTFYLKDGSWVDSEFQDQKTIDVKTGSQAYLDLVLRYQEIAKFAALGKVTFKFKDRFVRIGDTGREQFTQKELEGLF